MGELWGSTENALMGPGCGRRGKGAFDFVAASLSRSSHFAQDDSGLVRLYLRMSAGLPHPCLRVFCGDRVGMNTTRVTRRLTQGPSTSQIIASR